MCRKLNLFIIWETLPAVLQQKGWHWREETERGERSELGNIKKTLMMERIQRIPVNILGGSDFPACKGNVFLRAYLMPDIFIFLTLYHQQVSGKSVKTQHVCSHSAFCLGDIIFSNYHWICIQQPRCFIRPANHLLFLLLQGGMETALTCLLKSTSSKQLPRVALVKLTLQLG